MRHSEIGFIRKFLREELGQTAVVVALTITTVMAFAATSVEVGHIYYAYRLLVASTNSATLAGAQEMSNALTSTLTSQAYNSDVNGMVSAYSSVPGGKNATSFLNESANSITTTFYCLTLVTNAPLNVPCETPPGGGTGYNALKVRQTAQVNLWFGGLIGVRSMTIAAQSSAAMRGGNDTPYNLAIIMDTTASMATTMKGNKNCTTSQIECAVQGFLVMLQNMDPCALNTTCSSSSTYVDDVALFVFPAVSTKYSSGNYSQDYCSSGGKGTVTSVPYNFVNVTPGAGVLNLNMENSGTDAGTYEIIPFNDLYKSTDDTTNLATSSALAEAVGYSGSGCAGLSAPGGQGTYYAQVIYQAQAALAAQQASNSASQNIMIILTDGNAGASATSGQIVAENNPSCGSITKYGNCLNGTGTSSTNPNKGGTGNNCTSGYECPVYPSALGQCGQAVQAAQAATAAGTIVYTIGFGSETSGCGSDSPYTVTSGATNGAEAWPGGLYPRSPCNAIASMASNVNTFYSDVSGGCPVLNSVNGTYQSLGQIFKAIVSGLTVPRLIPSSWTT